MKEFQRMLIRNVAHLRPEFESGRVGICILAFCIHTFGLLILMRSLHTAKTARSIPAESFGMTNLPDLQNKSNNFSFPQLIPNFIGNLNCKNWILSGLSDKKEINASYWHKELPVCLNNLNRKQIELGRNSNLKWTWSKSHALITQAIKQLYPGDHRNSIFLEYGKDLQGV